MTLRPCSTCGTPFTPRHARHQHCPVHEPHGRAHRSPTTQAQDAEYRAERARILVPGARCFYCGAPADTVDHHVSVARGGRHRGNLVPACTSCNASKGARPAPTTTSAGTAAPALAGARPGARLT